MPQTKTGRTVLCKPAESKCTQKSFMQQFTNEMPQTKAGTTVLREPAQSKYTWTYEKKNTKEFSSKMPQAKRLGQPFSASLRSPNLPGHQFYAKIIKSNAANQRQGQRACAIHMHLDV